MKYFKVEDFACPCCGRNETVASLMDDVDEIRQSLGVALHITSGWRCAKHNATLHDSSPNSLHLKGLAVDILTVGLVGDKKFELLRLGMERFNGLGIGSTFIHFDLGRKRLWTY